ncbi:PepSY domain-containing protein [Streptomyces mayteni]
MKRKVILTTVVASAVIGGGALTAAAASGSSSPSDTAGSGGGASTSVANSSTPSSGDDSRDRGPEGGSGSAAQQAVGTALDAQAGVVAEVDFNDDDGGNAGGWEIEIIGEDGQWYKVQVNADGTQVVDSQVENESDTDDDDAAVADALRSADNQVDAAQAIDIALGQVSGNLDGVDFEDGHWDVEVNADDGTEHELSIDPASGDVTDATQDDQGEDASDDSDDQSDDESDDQSDGEADDDGQNQHDDDGGQHEDGDDD